MYEARVTISVDTEGKKTSILSMKDVRGLLSSVKTDGVKILELISKEDAGSSPYIPNIVILARRLGFSVELTTPVLTDLGIGFIGSMFNIVNLIDSENSEFYRKRLESVGVRKIRLIKIVDGMNYRSCIAESRIKTSYDKIIYRVSRKNVPPTYYLKVLKNSCEEFGNSTLDVCPCFLKDHVCDNSREVFMNSSGDLFPCIHCLGTKSWKVGIGVGTIINIRDFHTSKNMFGSKSSCCLF